MNAAWGAGSQPSRPPRRAFRLSRAFRLTGLRFRLLAGFAAVALITTTAIAGISYVLTRQAMVSEIQVTSVRQFRTDMSQEGRELLTANKLPRNEAQQQLQTIATSLSAGPQKMVLISGTGGFFSTGSILRDEVPASLREAARRAMVWQRLHIDGVPYMVLGTQIQPNGPEVYEFVSMETDEDNLRRLSQSYAYAAAVALVCAAVFALLAAQGVLRPIRRLGLAARRLGEGHLDTRAEVRGSDEIADVARTFNETAAALERGVSELRSMEAASRRFVADVSHELRTPLTAMTAVTDVLEEATDVGDQTAPATRLVVTETRRLARLVEDLIEVSRFDAGTAALRLEDVDMVQLVQASLQARGWSGAVELRSAEALVARVDPRRVDVIVANLAGNALRHGGTPVMLELSSRSGDVLVTVRDSGPGIPAEALPHVFDRFYKADKARGRSEGSGLGLSIAFENARMHGGELTARNVPTGGAEFTLVLPHAAVDAPGSEDDDTHITERSGDDTPEDEYGGEPGLALP